MSGNEIGLQQVYWIVASIFLGLLALFVPVVFLPVKQRLDQQEDRAWEDAAGAQSGETAEKWVITFAKLHSEVHRFHRMRRQVYTGLYCGLAAFAVSFIGALREATGWRLVIGTPRMSDIDIVRTLVPPLLWVTSIVFLISAVPLLFWRFRRRGGIRKAAGSKGKLQRDRTVPIEDIAKPES